MVVSFKRFTSLVQDAANSCIFITLLCRSGLAAIQCHYNNQFPANLLFSIIEHNIDLHFFLLIFTTSQVNMINLRAEVRFIKGVAMDEAGKVEIMRNYHGCQL